MENIRQMMETWAKVNAILLNEEFRALMLSLIVLHKRGVCTFNDVFEGSGLKRMGASTGTVSRALKILEKEGIIVKEKAPFPFKTRYRLIEREPNIDSFNRLLELSLSKLAIGDIEPIKMFPDLAMDMLFLVAKHLREGNAGTCALISFLLLDYLFHLALNMPETEAKIKIFEMKEEKRLLEKVLSIKKP